VAPLPSGWDAVFLGYHDDHGSLLTNSQADASSVPDALPQVRLLQEPLVGLFVWIERQEAAKSLMDGAVPIGGQVDHALSQRLVRERGRTYAVAPEGMFFSLKSEVGENSDVQTMATVDTMLSKYDSWAEFHGHIWGIEGLLEDSGIDGAFAFEEDSTWLSSMGVEQDWPACEAPTPCPRIGSMSLVPNSLRYSVRQMQTVFPAAMKQRTKICAEQSSCACEPLVQRY